MANPYRGEVKVALGGQERVIRVSWKELAEVKELFGDEGLGGLQRAAVSNDYGAIARAMVIFLSHNWEGVSVKDIFDISPTLEEVGNFMTAVVQAHNLCHFGTKEPPERIENPQKPPQEKKGIS